MATSVAEQLVEDLRDSGVQRTYGLVADSLNPIVDAVRRTEGIELVHVHNEEAAARLLRSGSSTSVSFLGT